MAAQPPSAEVPPEPSRGSLSLSTREVDAAKGALICLVVLGHDVLAQAVWPSLRPFLYNFHVLDFLLLPFLYPPRPSSLRFVADRAVRYLVPFAVFFTLSSALFLVVEQLPPDAERFGLYARGLLVGSAATVDAASGFRLFWFLPALLSVVVSHSAFHSASPALRPILVLLALLGFLVSGLIPQHWVALVPLGLPIVAYTFLPGLVCERLWRSLRRASRPWTCVVASAAFVGLSWLAFERGTSLVIAKLEVYSVFEPLSLAIHAAIPIAALVSLLSASPWLARSAILPLLGRHSLVVYLSHGLVYQALVRIAKARGFLEAPSAGAALAIYAVTLFASLAVALAIARSPRLRQLTLPRRLEDLRGALRAPIGGRMPLGSGSDRRAP